MLYAESVSAENPQAEAVSDTGVGHDKPRTSSQGPDHDEDWWSAHLGGLVDDDVKGRQFWAKRLEMLLSGIELTANQQEQVDAVIVDVLLRREQIRKIKPADKPSRAARSQNASSVDDEIQELRKGTHPIDVMDALRAFLDDKQKPTYDMNRAKVAAKFNVSPR